MDNKIVSIIGLAQELGVKRSWLEGEVKKGKLPFLKAGKKKIFNLETIRNIIAERAANGEGWRT